jgi:hypothetical protein
MEETPLPAGARLFWTANHSSSTGPDEATGMLGSSILLEGTSGIRAEEEQAIADILNSNERVSRL